jgi:hypothetical protein
MSGTAEQIRKNAEAIELLRSRVHETAKCRGRSQSDKEAWVRACEQFHAQYPGLMFPGGPVRWAAFLAGDSAEIETAIAFLQSDPWFFRSGYLKQIIWRRLKRFPLSTEQQRQLERIALAYLQKRIYQEFWEMVRFVRMRGSPEFWNAVAGLASANYRARWLLLARRNFPVKNWVGQELLRARYKEGYVPDLGLASRVDVA